MLYTRRVHEESLEVAPGPTTRQVCTAQGKILDVPAHWELLPPGDAGLTRRVKQSGPTWTVKEKKGRRTFSKGVWAPADNIAQARATLSQERSDPAYQKRLDSSRKRRAVQQERYAEDFYLGVLHFLNFAPAYHDLAQQVAHAIATHATPVGSGTVARTQRIPLERRAEAATIAWLRHQTTAYDDMQIARVKGMRREVRRMLAEQSRRLLAQYRAGVVIAAESCLLRRALSKQPHAPATP